MLYLVSFLYVKTVSKEDKESNVNVSSEIHKQTLLYLCLCQPGCQNLSWINSEKVFLKRCIHLEEGIKPLGEEVDVMSDGSNDNIVNVERSVFILLNCCFCGTAVWYVTICQFSGALTWFRLLWLNVILTSVPEPNMEHVVIEGAARHYIRRLWGLIPSAGGKVDAGACCCVLWDVLSLIILQGGLKGASRRLILDPQVSSSLAWAVGYLSRRRAAYWIEAHMAPVSPVSQGAMEVIRGYDGTGAPRALWKTTRVRDSRSGIRMFGIL